MAKTPLNTEQDTQAGTQADTQQAEPLAPAAPAAPQAPAAWQDEHQGVGGAYEVVNGQRVRVSTEAQ